MDKIFIRDLSLRTYIGIYPEEKEKKQEVLINLMIEADLSKAGQSDDIADTVDYKSLKNGIVTLVESNRFNLVEHLAERVADLCLANPLIHRARVTVDKPGALRFARSVAVEMERERRG